MPHSILTRWLPGTSLIKNSPWPVTPALQLALPRPLTASLWSLRRPGGAWSEAYRSAYAPAPSSAAAAAHLQSLLAALQGGFGLLLPPAEVQGGSAAEAGDAGLAARLAALMDGHALVQVGRRVGLWAMTPSS